MNKQKNIFSHLYNTSTLLDNYKAHSDPIYYIKQISTTQRIVLLQSLRMIVGFQGSIFKYNNIEGFHLTQIPQLKHLTPQALANMISLFTNFSNQIKYINNKIIQFRKQENVILHELLNEVEEYLKQNIQFFTQLTVLVQFQAGKINRKHAVNTQLGHQSQNPMTLIRLNAIVSIRFQTTKIISDIFQKILPTLSSPLNLSIVVLNNIWQLLDKFEHQPLTSSSSQLLLKLLNQPLKRYLQLVCTWFGQKISYTNSTSKQFFVKRDEDNYIIVDTLIPIFLKNTSKQIFDSGNFIKIIYGFANQQDKMNINQFMNTTEQFQRLFKLVDIFIINKKRIVPLKQKNRVRPFQTISSMMKKQKVNILKIQAAEQAMPYDLHISAKGIFELAYIPSRIHMPVSLEEQFQQLGNADSFFLSEFKLRFEVGWNSLLETIKSKCCEYLNFKEPVPPFNVLPTHVNNHLFFISNFILFEKGDFIQQLIDNIGEQLDKSVSIIQQNLLSDLIKTAIQNSNARFIQQDYFKNLYFKFLSKDSSYSGWDMFYLEYRLGPPFHHLFPQETMQRYNIIFNFVWRLKHLQYLLRNISINDKGQRNTKHYFIFRTALNQFSSSVISDILLKIKQTWKKFIQSLNKVQTLNQFLNLHNQVISNLQKITFISSKDRDRQTHLRLQNITHIVLKIRDLQKDNIEMDQRDKEREIVKLSQEFKMRMRDLVHINQSFTLNMVDFTGFYE